MIVELMSVVGLEMALILNGYSMNDINRIVHGTTVSYEPIVNNI
jgi:hypothetical protein